MQRRLPKLTLAALALTGACAARTGSIGAVLGRADADGRVTVRLVAPSLGGARAGLAAGDEVVSIDGSDVRDMSAERVHRALEGDVGSVVRLTVLRAGAVVRLAVERDPLRPR